MNWYYFSENEDEFICLTLAGDDLNSPGNPANVYVVVPVQQVFRWICNKLIECSQKQDREHDRKIDRKLGSDYAMRFLYVLRSRNLIHFRRLACAIFPSAGTALKYAKTVRTFHPLCGINVEEAIHFLQVLMKNEPLIHSKVTNFFFFFHAVNRSFYAVKPSTEFLFGWLPSWSN